MVVIAPVSTAVSADLRVIERAGIQSVFRFIASEVTFVILQREARYYVGRLPVDGPPVFFGPFVEDVDAIDALAVLAARLPHAA